MERNSKQKVKITTSGECILNPWHFGSFLSGLWRMVVLPALLPSDGKLLNFLQTLETLVGRFSLRGGEINASSSPDTEE